MSNIYKPIKITITPIKQIKNISTALKDFIKGKNNKQYIFYHKKIIYKNYWDLYGTKSQLWLK
jgi:hypothetical protein